MLTASIAVVALAIGYALYRFRKNGEELPRAEEIDMVPLDEPPSTETADPPPLDAAEDAERLRLQYATMTKNFDDHNLKTDSIAAVVKYYREKQPKDPKSGTPVLCDALTYAEVDGATAADTCRLVILPIMTDPTIAYRLHAASSKVLDTLSPTLRAYSAPAELLHITLFHTSRVEEPAPKEIEGAVARAALAARIKQEEMELTDLIHKSRIPCLEFHRIFLADSGVLLAVWIDQTTHVAELRRRFRQQYPDAPKRQANIIHTSLFRILTPEALSPDVKATISEICTSVTKDLAGLTWTPRIARVVNETHFSTVVGASVDVPFPV